MSVSNPRESVDALVGKTVEWCGRELCLTNASMIALSALGLDASPLENPDFVWALIWVSSVPADDLVCEIRKSSFGLHVVRGFAAGQNRDAWQNAARAASELLGYYNASVCRFYVATSADTTVGEWVAAAAYFLREYGVSFDEFVAMPASRMNALYAAACEREGFQPTDTYVTRANAPKLEAFLASANFDEKSKN